MYPWFPLASGEALVEKKRSIELCYQNLSSSPIRAVCCSAQRVPHCRCLALQSLCVLLSASGSVGPGALALVGNLRTQVCGLCCRGFVPGACAVGSRSEQFALV